MRMRLVLAGLTLGLLATACASHSQTSSVEAGAGKDAAAAALVNGFFGGDYYLDAIIEGTERHVVTATTEFGKSDLYAFEGDFEDRGHVMCWVINRVTPDGGGGGAGCMDELDPPPTSSGSGGSSVHTAWILGAPGDAAWFRVELVNGDSVTANVVNQASLAAWAGDAEDFAVRVVALDAEFNEVWSENREPPPPLPDVAGAGQAVEAVVEGSAD